MIATDIDGTIIQCSFTDGVKDCVKKLTEAGIKVVLVTGRMHCSTRYVARELGLKTPIVSYQGGLIKSYDGTTLYQRNLPNMYAQPIIEWARKNNIHLNLYLNDKLYVEKENDTIKQYIEGKHIEYEVCSFDDLELCDINKILAIDYTNEKLVTGWVEELKEKFPALYIVKSTPYFCEISNKDAKKSAGVDYLRKLWKLDKSEVMTIGDQNNDIELLKAGGIAVAMGNATDELKAVADYVTDTVENDGFVKAVEKFINFEETEAENV